jgi:WD40 repeat protein
MLTTIYGATWNQDGSKILTLSDDNTARIWNATTGQELLRLIGHTDFVLQATWNQEGSKVFTYGYDRTVRIWDIVTGKELVRLKGHMGKVWQAIWSRDEYKMLTNSEDGTVRIWDAMTGEELVRLEGHTDTVYQATWNQDESKVLTRHADGTAIIWYTQMKDLLPAACKWVPRNFTLAEWSIYLQDVQDAYRPTCPNAPIPPDAIADIQEEAHQQIRSGQVTTATTRLEELNGWLQVNGQFENYGVDVEAFVVEVSATATAEALPSPTVTPQATRTPVASSPVAMPGR